MHKPLFRIAAGSVAAVGGLLIASAMPAGAATSVRAETMAQTVNGPGGTEGTPVTFTVTSTGTLNITVPSGPVFLGSGGVGTIIGPTPLGPVTVTDYRATNPSNWTATVSSTDFTNTTSADTILAGAATYTTGTDGADTTDLLGGLPLPLAAGIVNNASGGLVLTTAAQDVVTENAADGANGATWTPSIALAVPAGAVVGIYDGTITHSVS
jgi:hypothetical protein